MTMTRDEVLSRRFTQSPVAVKHESADEIARQVERFQQRGGRIEQVPIGASGMSPPDGRKFSIATEANQRNAAAAVALTRRTNGKLSLTAAAKLAGMTLVEFRTLVLSGKGPKAFSQGHTFRFEERAVSEWLQHREKIERDLVDAMQNLRRRASA